MYITIIIFLPNMTNLNALHVVNKNIVFISAFLFFGLSVFCYMYVLHTCVREFSCTLIQFSFFCLYTHYMYKHLLRKGGGLA